MLKFQKLQTYIKLTIFTRHMTMDHLRTQYDKGDDIWMVCLPCSKLTTDINNHNLTYHYQSSQNGYLHPAPEDRVTVRLLLPEPSFTTLVGRFRCGDTVAAVLAAHSEDIREEVEDLGPGEEVTITCGDTLLLPGQQTILLSSLDRWNWAGEQEIHLEYGIRPSSIQLGESEVDELEKHLDRLVKRGGAGEEQDGLKEAAAAMNADRQTFCTGSDLLHQEMMVATRLPENPFHHKNFPFDINRNFYVDAITFSRKNLPRTYKQVLELRTGGCQFGEKDVIPVVQLLSQLMCVTSPLNSALSAMRSMFLKGSGLTNRGLDATQRSGFSQGSRYTTSDDMRL